MEFNTKLSGYGCLSQGPVNLSLIGAEPQPPQGNWVTMPFSIPHSGEDNMGDVVTASVDVGGTPECEIATTTVFVDALGVVCEKGRVPATPDDIPVRDQALRDFLSKPVKINQFSWNAADAPTHVYYANLDMWGIVAAQSQWMEKIHGHSMFRGTFCVRLQVNATPFEQGVLWMSYLPQNTEFNTVDGAYDAIHHFTLQNYLMLPGVQVNCGNSAGYLRIPYIAPTDWIDVKTGNPSWGTLSVIVLAQLQVGASAPSNLVDCTMFAWLEDVEFAGPTVPQTLGDIFDKKPINCIPHGKFSSGTVLSKEKEEMSEGSISKALSLGARVASSLSSIPSLGPLLGPTSWMLDGASGVASAFGWSKPLKDTEANVVSRMYNRRMPNSDGTDPSVALGLSLTNSTMVNDNLTVYQGDEMSMAFLLPKKTLIHTLNWTTARAVDYQLFQTSSLTADYWKISPRTCLVQKTSTYVGHTLTWAVGPPVGFFSGVFSFYRGSFDLTVQCVGTEFHSGRLLVSWTPITQSAAAVTPVTSGNAVLALKEILDIRLAKTFHLTLPWLVNQSYLPTTSPSGFLSITVLNALRCPETVAQNMDILVYIGGGSDFEFAAPTASANVAYQAVAIPQSGSGDVLEMDVIGGYDKRSINTLYSGRSMGENITSIKQLLNRYSRFQVVGVTSTNVIYMDPYSSGAVSIATGTGLETWADGGFDAFSLFAGMYAYQRGSVHMMCKTTSGVALNSSLNALFFTGGRSGAIIGSDSALTLSPSLPTAPVNAGGILAACYTHDLGLDCVLVKVPYYNQVKCSNNIFFSTPGQSITRPSYFPLGFLHFECGTTNSMTNPLLYRRVSDEFQFCFFLGCPPLFVSYS